MGTAAILRQTLSRARRYAEKLADAEKDPAKAPEPDFLLESLVPVVRGETRARIHCHRADDIATAIRICEEFGLTYSLEHVTEGWKVAGLLAEKQVECVLGPLLLGPVKQEVWDCRLENAAILQKEGVRFSLMADRAGDTAWLPMEIGVLLRHGLTLDTALEAVTVNPARLVGAIDRIGTIEPGKDADIAIFDGMPFSNQTLCRFTMIDGVHLDDTLPQNEKTGRNKRKEIIRRNPCSMKEIIATKSAPAAIGPYSQGISAGNLVITSGQLPVDPATVASLLAVLQSRPIQSPDQCPGCFGRKPGLTMENVIKTTVFLSDMNNFSVMNEVYATFFPQNPPARSAVEVARLPKNALVEIEAIACR